MKLLCLFLIISLLACESRVGELIPLREYKIEKPVFLIGEYIDRGNKTISNETAIAYLELASRAKMSYTAFRIQIPPGTTVTIIKPVPKPWYLYFNADYYVIKLVPDLSQGLEVMMQINGGLGGNLDGLSPEVFSRL